jgi:hypothetical protein
MVKPVQTVKAAQVASVAALLSAIALAGCADVLDIPSTSSLALAPSGPWRCIDGASEPPTPIGPTVTARFRACDFISNCEFPVTGLTVRVCDKLDVGCNNPRVDNVRDTGGLIEVDVPTGPRGFDGYLQVSTTLAPCFDTSAFGNAAGFLCQLVPECNPAAPTVACDVPVYFPVMWFFNPPLVADQQEPIPLQLYPSVALPLILDAAGGEFAPGTGSVFMTVIDCDGNPAPGVTLEIAEHEDQAYPLYFDSGVISNTAHQTDPSGVGGFIRIPPGFVEVTGVSNEGAPLGKVGVQTNATFVTYTVLAPSPVF